MTFVLKMSETPEKNIDRIDHRLARIAHGP